MKALYLTIAALSLTAVTSVHAQMAPAAYTEQNYDVKNTANLQNSTGFIGLEVGQNPISKTVSTSGVVAQSNITAAQLNAMQPAAGEVTTRSTTVVEMPSAASAPRVEPTRVQVQAPVQAQVQAPAPMEMQRPQPIEAPAQIEAMEQMKMQNPSAARPATQNAPVMAQPQMPVQAPVPMQQPQMAPAAQPMAQAQQPAPMNAAQQSSETIMSEQAIVPAQNEAAVMQNVAPQMPQTQTMSAEAVAAPVQTSVTSNTQANELGRVDIIQSVDGQAQSVVKTHKIIGNTDTGVDPQKVLKALEKQ